MGHKGLREPHILLLGNPRKVMKNLSAVLADDQINQIQLAVNFEVKLLFELGVNHYSFVQIIDDVYWRQKISRLYYAAYNVKRSVTLCCDGSFSTESSDHLKIDQLPADFKKSATYSTKLKALREDRNLADYSHLANESDLVITVDSATKLVEDFLDDSRECLVSKLVEL